MPKLSARLSPLILIAVLEAMAAMLSFVFSHGRIQTFLAWFSAIQLDFGLIAILLVWLARHKDSYATNLSRKGKGLIGIGTFLVIGLSVVWLLVLFPDLVRLGLRHYGINTLATVQSYELVEQGAREREVEASSLTQADSINVTLYYSHRLSTISIQKGDPAFSQVYASATKTGSEVPVCYLRWLPAIVLPSSDLR